MPARPADTTMGKIEAALATHPLLDGVDEAAKQELLRVGRPAVFAPDAALSREGEPAAHYWFLCQGSVKVFYTSPDGFEVTVKIFRAPAAWAEMEVLTGAAHIEDCVAVDKAVCLKIPKAAFTRFLDAHPRFMKNVLYDTCARFLIAAENEKALAFLPVAERLANLLLVYVRVYGVPVADGVLIRVKLSQADLANGLGAAKKSVTRTLSAWQEAGVLSKRGRSYVVHDLAQLAARSAHELVGIDWVAGGRITGRSTGEGPVRSS